MKLDYTIEKNDYLVFQLYTASRSDHIKRKRFRNKIIFPLIYAGLGIISLIPGNINLSVIFFIIGLLWFLFFPGYERKVYVKHFDKYINENYKNRFGKPESVEFENDFILCKDYSGESKLFLSEAVELNEIKDYYFLKFNSGVSLIIPKNNTVGSEQIDHYLKDLASRLKIRHNKDLLWKWK